MGPVIIGVFLFIVVCIVYELGGGLLYLIYWPFKKRLLKSGKLSCKTNRQINRAFISIILILALYTTWTAINPLDSFYQEEFKYNTGIDFPESGIITAKASEYPDLHGDYWASAIFKVKEDDYHSLKEKISQQFNFSIDTSSQKIGINIEYDELVKNINEKEIEIVYSNINKQWFKVAFLKDGKTIIFERSSS